MPNPDLTPEAKALAALADTDLVTTELPEPVHTDTGLGRVEIVPVNGADDLEALLEGVPETGHVAGLAQALQYARAKNTTYRAFAIELDGTPVGCTVTLVGFQYKCGWVCSEKYDVAFDAAVDLTERMQSDAESLLELDVQ